MSEYVFAFGSNMCSGRFRDYSVSPERPGVPARLSGYRLCFNKRSNKDGSGKANVERDAASEVWGVLYSIPDAHLPVLDNGEGGYARQPVVVQTAAGATVEAWAYIAKRADADPTLRPYAWYKRFLVEGAREHNLPVAYIDQLQAIESMDDPDAARDLQKRSLECKGTSEFTAAFPRGSEWRKWDLHMHTPASWDWKGGPRLRSLDNAKRIEVADNCLAALEATDIAVFAVQDHCTFEGYKLLRERIIARPTLFTKTLIPGIELRLEAPTPKRLHYHILFAPSVPVDRLEAFLCQLKMPNGTAFTRHDLISYANALDGGKKREFGIAPSDHPTDDDLLDAAYKSARVTRESVSAALGQLPPNAAVIMLPYSTTGGIKDLDWKKHPAEDQVYLHQAHLFEARNAEEISLFRGESTERNKNILQEFLHAIGGRPKACISGTDSHSVSGYGEYPGDKCTWIKGDPNFEGLLHAILEPRDRVYIGEKPPKIAAVASFPGRFLDKVTVRRAADCSLPVHEKWFDIALPLNSGLAAIIGNKGSGKSALADIFALLGNSHCGTFSFLNEKRFRKKPDRSNHFIGEVAWKDGSTRNCRLSTSPDTSLPERVRYLPQERIEELCNEIVAEGRDACFEEELRTVVFAHVPPDERLGAANLDELIDRRSAGIIAELEELRTAVGASNRKIGDLESRMSSESVARIAATVKQKEMELTALDLAMPPFVPPPDATGDPAAAAAMTEMTAAQYAKTDIEERLRAAASRRSEVVTMQVAVKSLYDRLGALEQTIARIEREMRPDLERAGITFAEIVSVTVNRTPLDKIRDSLQVELTSVDKLIGQAAVSGLSKELADAKIKAAEMQARLEAPLQRHQAYIVALAEWQRKRNELVGNATAPGSLEHARASLRYLQKDAPAALAAACEERWELARKVVASIERHASVKRHLYAPVQRFLEGKDFDHSQLRLEFVVTSAVNRFAPDFLALINQGRVGTFQGVDEGRKALDALIGKNAFDTVDGVLAFVRDVLGALEKGHGDGQPRRLDAQLRKERSRIDLYDLLFKFEWLRPHYALQLDGKPISLLSPGEKGALLIVFYLLLDPATSPLIIDQPEHNLDNESIMHLLVPCFKEAARRRQVIVVTHNPNLAVVADADQVIHAKIDRADGNRIKYVTGSLESSVVSRLAVNVLEGTLPAFNQRAKVYELVT